MKSVKTLLVAGLCAISALAFAAQGEFGDVCNLGLTIGKEVKTDCSVSDVIGAKAYYFSSIDAKRKFMKDPTAGRLRANGNLVLLQHDNPKSWTVPSRSAITLY